MDVLTAVMSGISDVSILVVIAYVLMSREKKANLIWALSGVESDWLQRSTHRLREGTKSLWLMSHH